MKVLHMIAALGAAGTLAGGAWAADGTAAATQAVSVQPTAAQSATTEAGAAQATAAEAVSGLLIEPHVSEEKAKQLANAFFDENGKRAGVVTLPSGVQYEVVKAGSGPRPNPDGLVRINYTGTLLDGTQFGGSHLGGKDKPAEFTFAKMIPGLRDAVARMEQGAKWRIYVPPQMGYSLHNPLFRKVTVFDLELVSVASQTAAASGRNAPADEHQVVGLR